MGEDTHSTDSANSKIPEELRDLLGPHWRRIPVPNDKAKPHRVRAKQVKGGRIATLISRRNPSWDNGSLSQNGLEYMLAGERDGHILRGYIALCDFDQSIVVAVVAADRATEVAKRIGNTPPIKGDYGTSYWWLDNTLSPVETTYRNDDEKPW